MVNETDKVDKTLPVENVSSLPGAGETRWRCSKALALGEFTVVVLIFVADWLHVVPLSKTPFLFLLGWISLGCAECDGRMSDSCGFAVGG
jgi:hypothetical protein